jgi:hypothetical protein
MVLPNRFPPPYPVLLGVICTQATQEGYFLIGRSPLRLLRKEQHTVSVPEKIAPMIHIPKTVAKFIQVGNLQSHQVDIRAHAAGNFFC